MQIERPGLLNLFWEWLTDLYRYHFTEQPFQMPKGRAQNVIPVHGHSIYWFNKVDKSWGELGTVEQVALKKMKDDPFTYYFSEKNDYRAKRYLKKLFNGNFNV